MKMRTVSWIDAHYYKKTDALDWFCYFQIILIRAKWKPGEMFLLLVKEIGMQTELFD